MTNVEISQNCIVLPSSIINRDTRVGEFCIINSACVLNGGVELGHNCYVGSGSSTKENCKVIADTTIGMCSLVLSSFQNMGTYFRSPANFIR